MKVFVLEGVDEVAFLRKKIKEKTEKNVNKTKPSSLKKYRQGLVDRLYIFQSSSYF